MELELSHIYLILLCLCSALMGGLASALINNKPSNKPSNKPPNPIVPETDGENTTTDEDVVIFRWSYIKIRLLIAASITFPTFTLGHAYGLNSEYLVTLVWIFGLIGDRILPYFRDSATSLIKKMYDDRWGGK